jgi:hypothetical protein
MATRIKMLKLLQELRGFSDLERATTFSKSSAVHLLQWQPRRAPVRRRIEIAFDARDIVTLPSPVTIVHRAPGSPA